MAHPSSLNEREQHLLKTLIEDYIRSGQPVGSRNLARSAGLSLSAATVRNVMADLEDLGLVTAPHTSAGRVPTVQGYRLFVDSLLNIRPLKVGEIEKMRFGLSAPHNTHGLIESASGLLSEITRMAGVVTLPRHDQVVLKQIEFLKLSEGRVLVILVTHTQEVHNRIIVPGRDYSGSELIEVANYLNEKFAGLDMHQIHMRLLEELKKVQQDMNQLMLDAISLGEKIFSGEDETGDDYVLAGETSLMDYDELSDIKRLRHLFEAFHQKRDILSILDQCITAEGVKIFIGHESGSEVLNDCSVISAPYEYNGEVVGVLGVIGPTRMAYDRVIPVVDITAKLLTAALNSKD